ncbi:cytochrome P450 [Laetiporus sulphureus 93-53]|uniref:Cytochrome P450 n=1 Tax=Laetiporus sulphureus 93-53 TaxID=1314785 RepID=A0A165DXD1_9APHY|nr:cytochrome P450 [Laetiporus sulphureus 93-53]KZT05818.1 cytochrome P450 [Laetiporus sulphureus 93-53]
MSTLEGGLALAFGLGFVAYVIFKRYELNDLLSLSVLLGLLPAIPAAVLRPALQSTAHSVLLSYAVHFSTLLASLVAYRLSPWHPLAKHPGPLPCKLSKLWLVYVTSRGKLHEYFRQLHETYGPVVRVGPNELSVIDVELLPSILGANGMHKGPLWEGRRNEGRKGTQSVRGTLIESRNRTHHAEARRIWNRVFTTQAVKGYEPIAMELASMLVDGIRRECERDGGTAQTDMARWLSFFSFDFMGDFAFGAPFDLLRDGDKHGLWQLLEDELYLPALTQHIPWFAPVLLYIPWAVTEMLALGQFASKQIAKRLKDGPVHNDLFYHLLDEGKQHNDSEPPPIIPSNAAMLAVVAGSDTTATALSNTLYFLLANPECYARLQEEIDANFPPGKGDPVDCAKLAQMEYLNAVINESLRLLPSILTCLQRAPEPGSGGHILGSGDFIPEGTAVYVPPYVLHHHPSYFSPKPDTFWPERWLVSSSETKADFVLEQRAYIPFSTGPANCAGRPVALMELRMVLASVLQAFRLEFAKGYDAKRWEEDMQDLFLAQKGALPVMVTVRAVPGEMMRE